MSLLPWNNKEKRPPHNPFPSFRCFVYSFAIILPYESVIIINQNWPVLTYPLFCIMFGKIQALHTASIETTECYFWLLWASGVELLSLIGAHPRIDYLTRMLMNHHWTCYASTSTLIGIYRRSSLGSEEKFKGRTSFAMFTKPGAYQLSATHCKDSKQSAAKKYDLLLLWMKTVIPRRESKEK